MKVAVLLLCVTSMLATSENVPEYLAIVAKGRVKPQVNSYTLSAMTHLLTKYPKDQELLNGYKVK